MTDRYTYRVTWSAEDEKHVGLCAEFPSLSWLADGPDDAFSGIRSLVSHVLAGAQTSGEQPPKPLADRTYSGRFRMRVSAQTHHMMATLSPGQVVLEMWVPPETHRALAIQAAEEGVDMDDLIGAKLTLEDSYGNGA